MNTVTIIHISDLHISEQLIQSADESLKLPHRYGHDFNAFLALDNFLNNEEWDILAISGDISRVGNNDSFIWARNWIEGTLKIDNYTIGLDINNKKNKNYVIVPGNHDRFNGNLQQTNLDKYYRQFNGHISGNAIKQFNINNQIVNFHMYDSSTSDKSFAFGEIEHNDLIPKKINNNEIDIAILHHHFLQPPEHKREYGAELKNSAQVAAYMIENDFQAILFGHTHQSFIDLLTKKFISNNLNDKRKVTRFFKRILPSWILRRINKDDLVSYKRVKTKNGKFPTFAYYFDYLYIKSLNIDIKGPSKFKNTKKFYKHVDTFKNKEDLNKKIKKYMDDKVLISMAPSACQYEAEKLGLHKLTFNENNERNWEIYNYNNGSYNKT